jgi:hypothetical protein
MSFMSAIRVKLGMNVLNIEGKFVNQSPFRIHQKKGGIEINELPGDE